MDDSRWTTAGGSALAELDARHHASAPPVQGARPIKLASEPPLRVGPLNVEPALRRVTSLVDGKQSTIQPRVMQVLVALAQAAGEILSRDDLLATCWHGVVVGEDSIDRVIGRLRRLCEDLASGALRVETVPRVGYRLIGATVRSTPAFQSPPPPAAVAEGTPVLAVLAFDNLSGDPDFLYFSDGISEEVLLTVGKTTGMKVIGRSSSFQFRGTDKSVRRMADELGATHVLDGAVRRSGDSVRINAELVDCATQTCLWSDRFDRRLSDVFGLQDEIAAAVAAALKARFAPSPDFGPIDPGAYDLYLRARDRSPEQMGFDTSLLEATIERAPGFANAWALLAYARGIMLNWSEAGGAIAVRRAEVLDAAHRALSLDPSAAYAYMALEMAEPICGHYAERCAWLGKAQAAAPNDPLVLVHAGGLHDSLGYQRLAYGYIVRAYQLDPRHAAFYFPYLLEAIGLGGEARAVLDHDIARWPDSLVLRTMAIRFACEAGDWESYDRGIAQLPPGVIYTPFFSMLMRAADRMRYWSPVEAADVLEDLQDCLEATGTAPVSSLGFPASRGLTDEIYKILDKASFAHLHEPHGQLTRGEIALNVIFTPGYAAMRRDVRFVKLCTRLGLADYWLKTDHWPDFLTEVAPYYDLKAETRRLARA